MSLKAENTNAADGDKQKTLGFLTFENIRRCSCPNCIPGTDVG